MGDVMAKANDTAKVNQSGAAPASNSVADTVEQQVVAFAEQLGRIVGTVQAKAEGWLDRDALNEQITHVRDSASALLEQLGAQKITKLQTATTSKRTAGTTVAPAAGNRGRSGGVVDAPGKKHRKPTANVARANVSARANAADAGRVAKMKAANASHRRGRG
jgi:hypothetical protein